MTDTGWWSRNGERFFIKQDEKTGDITAESETGCWTAYKDTWEAWKSWGKWVKEEELDK